MDTANMFLYIRTLRGVRSTVQRNQPSRQADGKFLAPPSVIKASPRYKKRSHETTDKHITWLVEHGEHVETVLIGTSMLERFDYTPEGQTAWHASGLAKLPIFNCSVGGDRIENILYRLEERRVLDSIPRPTPVSAVVLMAGANDVERGDMDSMVAGMQRILQIIQARFSGASVHVLGMYPRRSDKLEDAVLLRRVEAFNGRLEKVVGDLGYPVTYHYFGGDVLMDTGEIDARQFFDLVHFSAAGYTLFAKRLAKLLT